MAAPQVSAVVALVASTGVTDVATIRQLMRTTAIDLGAPGWDDQYGDGLVQAGAAARAANALVEPAAVTSPASAPTPTGPATIEPVPIAPAPAPLPPADPAPVSTAPAPLPAPTPLAPPAPTSPLPSAPVGGTPAPVATSGEPRSFDLACPSATTPTSPFGDLGATVHARGVGCAAWWGVAAGRTPTTFDPAGAVTRGQLASFVARTLEAAGMDLPASAPGAFADDAGSVHEARIDQLAALGVVSGRANGTYAPDAVVTRAEMATFLARAHDVVSAADLATGPDRFADDDGSVHAGNIDKVAAAGLAGGTSATTFAPSAPVQRGQMATFLARSIDLFIAEGTTSPR